MYGRMSKHNLWPDLTYENRRNYLFFCGAYLKKFFFLFYEKSFGKLVFDPFFRECSNLYVFTDWLKNILSKWGLDPFFLEYSDLRFLS